LIGLLHRRHACFSQGQAATGGFEQFTAQIFFQFAHLGTDGLHGHVQFLGGFGNAAFLGHDPEVVEVLVVKRCAHRQ
jgi:hypothetical protein